MQKVSTYSDEYNADIWWNNNVLSTGNSPEKSLKLIFKIWYMDVHIDAKGFSAGKWWKRLYWSSDIIFIFRGSKPSNTQLNLTLCVYVLKFNAHWLESRIDFESLIRFFHLSFAHKHVIIDYFHLKLTIFDRRIW